MFYHVTSGEAPEEYLYSQVGQAVRTVTIASGVVTADVNGNKILNKGIILAKITSGANSGKYGPHDDSVSDGRQTRTNIRGVNDTYVKLDDGDVLVGCTYEGTLREDKVKLYESGTLTAVKNSVNKADLKAQMELSANEMDITFVDGSV